MNEPLLEVEDLTVQYQTKSGWITAVSDATFTIDAGEYFGLVGESGCGKSTLAKSLIGDWIRTAKSRRAQSGTRVRRYRDSPSQN